MIETYNESSLHRTLKLLYAEKTNGITEQNIDGKICDIVADKNVVEIQTRNLSKLAGKIEALIPQYHVQVVYPLVTQKIIETQNDAGAVISLRKSPKKQNIYSIFRELSGLYPWIIHPQFLLEVLFVTVKEIRIQTDQPIQLANKSRHHYRAWYKKDKILLTLDSAMSFSRASDYIALLPESLPKEFTTEDIAKTAGIQQAKWMVWVLKKSGIIAIKEKKGRRYYYEIKPIPQ